MHHNDASVAAAGVTMTGDHNWPAAAVSRTDSTAEPHLRRTLTLPLVVLYGLGVTIGAGIYVLVGATAGVAGALAPLSFVLAALVMLPSACSFAELVGRFPVSAGEAAYVGAGLRRPELAVLVGLMVVVVGTVSAAAICVGSVGYIRQFVDLSDLILVPFVVAAMTFIAAWGVRESVTFAAVLTGVEILGLVIVIAAGLLVRPAVPITELVWPSTSMMGLGFAIMSGGILAFFAFVGFEDLVNIAEETETPERTLPRAIFITLGVSTLLYVLVAFAAVLNVPTHELATAKAPLSLVFERTTHASPAVISAIAIVATLNGVIVQIIMASRVVYGLSRQDSLPRWLGYVHPVTRTPLVATAIIGTSVYVLATIAPLRGLAETTSLITLTIFAFVNLALLQIKRRDEPAPTGTFMVPFWVPIIGLVSCALFLIVGLF